jgi:two-component system, NarL family, sensor histidine kinase DesK
MVVKDEAPSVTGRQTGPSDDFRPASSAFGRAVSGADAAPPRFALAVVFTVLAGFFTMQVVDILGSGSGALTLLLSFSVLPASIAMIVVQVLPGCRLFRERWGRWLLLAQVVLVTVPCLLLGWCWGGMGGFVGASALLVLPTATAVPVFALVTGLIVLGTGLHDRFSGAEMSYMGISTVLAGIIVCSLIRLANLTIAVHDARDDFARIAVTKERLRFARDLHDLLGYSLSAITLKSELAAQLVSSSPDRAREELRGIVEISRQALADVREVASSYRSLSLLNELSSARAVLSAAGVKAHLKVDYDRLTREADTALATVVREGVTNAVRHSKASRCLIEALAEGGVVTLRIVNDGVPRGGEDPGVSHGSGLDSLAARMAAIGGRLSAGATPDGCFHLVAQTAGAAAPEDPEDGRDAEGDQTQPASRAMRTASKRLRAPSFTTEDVK